MSHLTPLSAPVFNLSDIAETFIGQMRQPRLTMRDWTGRYVSEEFFICRSRYLLTQIEDIHLQHLLAAQYKTVDDACGIWHGKAAIQALWLAGLLKKEQFLSALPQALFLKTSHRADQYKGLSDLYLLYSSLFLFAQTAKIARILQDFIRGLSAPGAGNIVPELAASCLFLLDDLHGSNFSHGLQKPANHQQYVNRIAALLELAQILRCGSQEQESGALQAAIAAFIHHATPVSLQMQGALSAPCLRPYAQPLLPQQAQIQQVRSIWQQRSALRSLPGADIAELIAPVKTYTATDKPARPNRDHFLQQRMHDYLIGAEPEIFWLQVGVGAANNAFDILSALEMDIGYKLPQEMAFTLYQKLAQRLPFDADMYREAGYGLLLRGNQYDRQAAQMLARAEELDQEQVCLRDYPLVRMPADSAPLKKFPFAKAGEVHWAGRK